MVISFDLLNNSIDYLENSLNAYIQADENGEYGNFADEKNKSRFKVAFVLLCQAMELLLKYKLQKINSALVYENIDQIINQDSKTVDAIKTIIRLKNLCELDLTEEEENFIKKSFFLRNRYIHYECEFDCERMKEKYAKLFVIYKKLYKSFTDEELNAVVSFKDQYFQRAINNLVWFDDKLIVFRGEEIKKEW